MSVYLTGWKDRAGRHRVIRLYAVWRNIKQRCLNPNNPRYDDYGGRGIAICNEWLIFSVFRDWCLRNGYRKGLTIDRVNNDLGYNPDNCRWTTMKVQCKNRRGKKKFKLTYDQVAEIKRSGETTSVLAKLYGVSYCAIRDIRKGNTWKYVPVDLP